MTRKWTGWTSAHQSQRQVAEPPCRNVDRAASQDVGRVWPEVCQSGSSSRSSRSNPGHTSDAASLWSSSTNVGRHWPYLARCCGQDGTQFGQLGQARAWLNSAPGWALRRPFVVAVSRPTLPREAWGGCDRNLPETRRVSARIRGHLGAIMFRIPTDPPRDAILWARRGGGAGFVFGVMIHRRKAVFVNSRPNAGAQGSEWGAKRRIWKRGRSSELYWSRVDVCGQQPVC